MGSPLSILVLSFNPPAQLEQCLASLVDQAA